MKRVLKYATGQKVPDNAIYLCTLKNGKMNDNTDRDFIYHYFLVEGSP